MKKQIFSIYIIFLLFIGFVEASHPFHYDLHLTSTASNNATVMITAHGMGGNYSIANSIPIEKTLVSFNFPDHDFFNRGIVSHTTTFGTIDELMPLLYVIKKYVIDDRHEEIDLYGFSAGGGAIINVLAALNTNRCDQPLQTIGIGSKEKEAMLQAIQKGIIILDTPLKSIEEILDFRGNSLELELLAKRYKKNDMEPINSIKYLNGLTLNIIVHFQNPDEVLSNRDDELFFNSLKTVNSKGSTRLIIGTDQGHSIPHATLWNFYFNEIVNLASK